MKFWMRLNFSFLILAVVASWTSLYYNKTSLDVELDELSVEHNDIEKSLKEIELFAESMGNKQERSPDELKRLGEVSTKLSALKSRNAAIQTHLEEYKRSQYKPNRYAITWSCILSIAAVGMIICTFQLQKANRKLRLGEEAELSS